MRQQHPIPSGPILSKIEILLSCRSVHMYISQVTSLALTQQRSKARPDSRSDYSPYHDFERQARLCYWIQKHLRSKSSDSTFSRRGHDERTRRIESQEAEPASAWLGFIFLRQDTLCGLAAGTRLSMICITYVWNYRCFFWSTALVANEDSNTRYRASGVSISQQVDMLINKDIGM